MAGTTDARASSFNAAEFRDGIKFAMSMALPDDSSERLTFRWKTDRTFTTADPVGKPYSYSDVPASVVVKDDVQITAGVQFIPKATSAAGNALAAFEAPRVVITVLDDDYDSVSDADEVLLDGAVYEVSYWEPPQGLFDVTIYKVHCTARDEA